MHMCICMCMFMYMYMYMCMCMPIAVIPGFPVAAYLPRLALTCLAQLPIAYNR